MQYAQLLLKFRAKRKASTVTKDPMYGASTHLMTNIEECYDKVLAQSKSITELLLEGQYVDWKHCDIKEFSYRLDYIKACAKTQPTPPLTLGI